MLEATEITHLHDGDQYLEVVATFEERQRSRYRTQTSCGRELAWYLERGRVLTAADVLRCTDGTLIKIVCASEEVTEVRSNDPLLMLRAAYHLGNRHVPLQVSTGFLRYQRDHVLDAMIDGLGLLFTHELKSFQPESGAYSGGHAHSH